jgi:hypothetical protein
LSRPSTPFSLKGRNKDVDARDKRGHDVERWFDLIGTRSKICAPSIVTFDLTISPMSSLFIPDLA